MEKGYNNWSVVLNLSTNGLEFKFVHIRFKFYNYKAQKVETKI